MLTSMQLLRLKQAAHDAVLCELATKLPAELTVAQWALESGWGSHQPGNNCFGIKQYDGCAGVQSVETVEFSDGVRTIVAQEFATFPSLLLCCQQHADLITGSPSYSKAWANYLRSSDKLQLIKDVAPIYATDPGYSSKLLNIVQMDEVTSSIKEFRATVSAPVPETVQA
jgi:flagellum-specific peptidoglycan hydrolase FlgJ